MNYSHPHNLTISIPIVRYPKISGYLKIARWPCWSIKLVLLKLERVDYLHTKTFPAPGGVM